LTVVRLSIVGCIIVGFAHLCALTSLGCGGGARRVFSDLPLVVDGEQPAIPDGVAASLQIGHEDEEGAFVEFTDGGPMPVIRGPQGGRWLHLVLRAYAMRREGQVNVALRRDGPQGELVAAAAHRILLSPTFEGFIEARDVPVAVPLSDSDIAALDGQPAHLHIEYEAADRRAEVDVALVFDDE
jgi:hypothetical protein